ncbi:MAG TPA: hypothetical protein HPP57_04575 [Deltaproteobacteria bacterium]|jgi:hypothetical protein|nr:hypothetical protein [Deltaproteobacteria bacterium]
MPEIDLVGHFRSRKLLIGGNCLPLFTQWVGLLRLISSSGIKLKKLELATKH